MFMRLRELARHHQLLLTSPWIHVCRVQLLMPCVRKCWSCCCSVCSPLLGWAPGHRRVCSCTGCTLFRWGRF